ncbi:MAG: succinylglutamate desuccinylase/aspartoacylase family protein [Halobacteriaceae archaeon]
MRVERLGDGPPEVAVVGGIHGDEPCGIAAVRALMESPPAVSRPVALVIANERAAARGTRYIDSDLNRAFPGDPAGDHEARLAARLDSLLADCSVLALHSTQSHDEPFAVVDAVTDRTSRLCRRLPIKAVVETGSFVNGRLFASADVVEVECGRQLSTAATENAKAIARAFLAAEGVLPDPDPPRDLPVFRLRDRVPKGPAQEYDVRAENFTRVETGEAFAAADGEPVLADQPFYPVLMSPEGYDEVFGYAAERVGTLN